MKILAYMIAALAMLVVPQSAYSQDMAQTSQPSLADPPGNQMIKPLAGDIVFDKDGEGIGTVSQSKDQRIIVTTTRGKITVPLASLYTGPKGLTLNMTKSEVDAAIQATH